MILIVLILADASQRSLLAARLTLLSADVVTGSDFDDPRLNRSNRRNTILVTDSASVELYPQGAAALAQDPRWREILVIGGKAVPALPRLVPLPEQDAAAAVAALVERWQAEQ